MVLLEFNGVVRKDQNVFVFSIPKSFADRNKIVSGSLIKEIVLGDCAFKINKNARYIGSVLVVTIPTYLVGNGYVTVGVTIRYIDVSI